MARDTHGTSYDDVLDRFSKEVDEEQARTRRQRIKSTPNVTIVGFEVPEAAHSQPSSVTHSEPVSIPSTRTSTSGTSSTSRSARSKSPLSTSLEELKVYKTKIDGWSSPTDQPRKETSPVQQTDPTPSPKSNPTPKSTSPKPAPQVTSTSAQTSPEASLSTSSSSTKSDKESPTTISPANASAPSTKPVGRPPPKPKLTRAERRALQEQQRAASAAKKAAAGGAPPPQQPQKGGPPQANPQAATPKKLPSTTPPGSKKGPIVAPSPAQADVDPKRNARRTQQIKSSTGPAEPEKPSKEIALFSHLPQYEKRDSESLHVGFAAERVHPAVIALGLKYAAGVIVGSNARCVAMLTAFREVIKDYKTPAEGSLHRELDGYMKPQIQFLIDCRPMSISMGNAINYLKREITQTQGKNEEEAKEYLLEKIEAFIEVRIVLADKAIASYGVSKIIDGDVILTFARSHSVQLTLETAHEEGKKFRVIIVDARPTKEGKELLQRLISAGIHCTYVFINAVSYAMKEATKVFVGAHTMLANGSVISRAGTALVASMAGAYHVPVIVCCETYKFCERVQLDSICSNELGDPDALIHDDISGSHPRLKGWKELPNLKLLNLMYDVTPMKYVAMVITEVGLIPPTSVPVVIREYHE